MSSQSAGSTPACALQLGSLFRIRSGVGGEGILPAGMALGADLGGIPCGVQVGRDDERGLGPAQLAAGGGDLVGPQGLAVGLGRTGAVG